LFTETEEPQTSLLPYLQLLWERRRFLLRAMLSAAVASALVAVLIPNRYHSATRLMPPDSQSAAGLGILAALSGGGAGKTGMSGLSALAGDLMGVKSSGALFVGIIGSETVQDRLIEQFNLRKGIFGTSKIEDARLYLAEHTDVSEDRKSGIITIDVTDRDPKRSAAMARAYVNELDRLVAQVSTSSARRERIFLEERLKTVKAELDTTAKNFSNFASKNTAIDIPAQGKAMVEAAAALQGRLIAAQAELSGLQQIYTANNVRVRSAAARVSELQQKLNELGGGDAQGNTKETDSLYPSIRKLPVLGVTYADLFLQTKIQATVFELLTQQYELAKVQEAKEIPSVKVLDAAVVPTKKSFPPRLLLTILGTMTGFAVAAMWVLGNQKWEATDSSDPRKMFAQEVFLTVWARIPKFSQNGSGKQGRGRFWSKTGRRDNEAPKLTSDDDEGYAE
jgi:capsule polysaccharide export protein KpsE/RkpR